MSIFKNLDVSPDFSIKFPAPFESVTLEKYTSHKGGLVRSSNTGAQRHLRALEYGLLAPLVIQPERYVSYTKLLAAASLVHGVNYGASDYSENLKTHASTARKKVTSVLCLEKGYDPHRKAVLSKFGFGYILLKPTLPAIDNLFRNGKFQPGELICEPPLELIPGSGFVRNVAKDKVNELTYTETRLLTIFMKHPGKTFSSYDLAKIVDLEWDDEESEDGFIKYHIFHIRRKLEIHQQLVPTRPGYSLRVA